MFFLKMIIEFVMDILETIVFVGSMFIVVYLFVMQPNQVKGASMEPTFHTNEYIFTSKISYKFKPYERGDVIVFRSPKNPDIEYIKRIIGLPGDTVTITDSIVTVNNIPLQEGYIAAATNLWDAGFTKNAVPFIVPEGQLYVMGDNRPRSSDSREFGPIMMDGIIGHVFYRYFPANVLGWVVNPFPDAMRRKKALLFRPYPLLPLVNGFDTAFKQG